MPLLLTRAAQRVSNLSFRALLVILSRTVIRAVSVPQGIAQILPAQIPTYLEIQGRCPCHHLCLVLTFTMEAASVRTIFAGVASTAKNAVSIIRQTMSSPNLFQVVAALAAEPHRYPVP